MHVGSITHHNRPRDPYPCSCCRREMNSSKALIIDDPSHFEFETNRYVMSPGVSIGDYTDDDAVSEFEGFGFDFDNDGVSTFSFNSVGVVEDKSGKKRPAVTPPIDDNDDDVARQAKKGRRSSSSNKQTIDNDCASEHLTIGDVVYATPTHRETKKRGKSSTIFRRGTVVEVVKKDQCLLSYGIAFDNSRKIKVIDKSLVVSEHRYLHDNLKQRLEVGQRVVAAWWENAYDTSSPPAGWYPGVIKAFKEKQEGGKFGPDRFYDIKFDDGDKLDDIEDIFVFKECEYELLSRQDRDKAPRWKGVRNVLDKGSTDRWAQTVGYWELDNQDGYQKSFPFLGDALRCYDDYIVSCRGANIKRKDLNLPDEWVIDSEAKCPPVRCNVQLVDIETNSSRSTEENDAQVAAPAPAPAPEDTPTPTRRVSQDNEVLFASTDEQPTPTKLLPEQSEEAQNRDNAIIKRGDNVYVVSRGENASSNTQLEWLPGRVWAVKVRKNELSNSPVKTYDVIFENNDVESDLDEMWVMKKEEYDALTLTADSAIPQCTSPGPEEHFHEDEEITSEETDRNDATKNQVQNDAKYSFSDEDTGRIASVLNDDDQEITSKETDSNVATKSQLQFDPEILLSEEDIGLLIQEVHALKNDDADKKRTSQAQPNALKHSPANEVNTHITKAPREPNEGMAHMMAHLHVMMHFVH